MSTQKHIDKLCFSAIILSLLLMLLFMKAEALGIQAASKAMGYEQRLFDPSQVHTIDIVMDDWDSFIERCENEEYAVCSVVIDGETYKNVGIRAKGNTSLSAVSSMNSDRYSFKIEFDQYDSTKTYHGLDKLSLNNLIQDNTMMKDYLTYQMMGEFGAVAPLCSYTYITVNGEDWGLYLAVEGVEESFLQRNYGSDYGELYKPDSMDMGGGRGNGRDFDMENFMNEKSEETSYGDNNVRENHLPPEIPENGMMGGFGPSTMFGENGELPENFDFSQSFGEISALPEGFDPPVMFGGGGRGNMGGMGGMGSSDAKLQYIDDDPESYSTIFNSAKTDITKADKTRLIQSLKSLSKGENIEDVVAVENVLRYFVVHNFVVNGDSYTGSMIHNYYLYEENGQLSMLPWDYNLAFGSFQAFNATDAVNDPIDTPLSVTGNGDRPMIDWIFSSEEYTRLYHQYFAEFLEHTDFTALIDQTAELIAPYVEKDPSKFCTYEDFEAGVAALRSFCLLRAESVRGQLTGTIPATTESQRSDASALIDASQITISDMGTMNMGGRGGPGNMGDRGTTQSSWFQDDMTGGRGSRGEMPRGSEGNEFPSFPGQSSEPAAPNTANEAVPPNQESPAFMKPATAFGRTNADNGQPQFPGEMQAVQPPGGQMPGAADAGVSQASSQNESWIMLGISAASLLFGLVVSFKFKRHH